MSGVLLVAAAALPLLLAAACLSARLRERMAALLVLAPLPALAAALLVTGSPPVTLQRGLVPITLALDVPGAMLLGVSALLWIAAGAYAAAELRGRPVGGQFAVCWLLTLSGSVGVFIAADLASFFMAYALVSLPAYGLVVLDDTGPARRAGAIYLAFAVLGETLLLMGFALLAAAAGRNLLIRDALAALPASPWRDIALALLIAGFGMKIALVPLHVWMPLTYRAAPIPAAAVLSGAAVKAGVIGLIRFLPLGTAMPAFGEGLAALGLFAAFYGVAVGVTQPNPKTVLAYSSISQMGLIATVLGMGLAAGDTGVGTAAAFYGAQHVLVKGALFLAVGVAAGTGARRPWPVLLPASVLALGLGGLPLTGGALAKLAVKGALGEGVVGLLANLSAAGSTLLMIHFMRRLTTISAPEGEEANGEAAQSVLAVSWLVLAGFAIAVPWTLYPLAAGGSRLAALAPASLWASLWPVLLGALLSLAMHRFEHRLPRLPEGDLVALGRRAVPAAVRVARACERLEAALSQWPVASLALLAAAILLGAGLLVGR
jgi:formate hydrogenlyase subunit 3/multisubunit Na+/H+ antiporter MnhD subunit